MKNQEEKNETVDILSSSEQNDKAFTPAIDKEIEEYTRFAFDRNMIQVAVGLILANAFQKTVTGLSDYLIMPIVNYFVNSTKGNWRDWVFRPFDGMEIEIGRLAGLFCDFFVISIILYFIAHKVLKKIWPEITFRFK